LRTAIKKVRVELARRNPEAAASALAKAIPVIDKAAAKGFIHKNAAARYKSRLARQVNALPRSS
jgi:small subunit ribosomal protein S20